MKRHARVPRNKQLPDGKQLTPYVAGRFIFCWFDFDLSHTALRNRAVMPIE